MPGYRIRQIEYTIGDRAYQSRMLSDLQPFFKAGGHHACLITCAGDDVLICEWQRGKLARAFRSLQMLAFATRSERVAADQDAAPAHRGRMLHTDGDWHE